MYNLINNVWVVYDTSDPVNYFKAAFVDKHDAEGATSFLRSKGSPIVHIDNVPLHHSRKEHVDEMSTSPNVTKSKPKKKKLANVVTEHSDDELTGLGSDGSKATPKPKKAKSPTKSEIAAVAPKDIEGAKDDGLAGVKICFAGNIPMGHKTAEATAKKYGAGIASCPSKADYVVIGKNPGDKKNEKIEKSSAIRLNEESFVELIQIGVPTKLKRVAEDNAASGDRPAKRQKE